MMKLKECREILKALADDTRLRIIMLLQERPLSVNELANVLEVSQPNVSKHLAKLRLTGILGDRREGMNVFYYLASRKDAFYQRLLRDIVAGLEGVAVCKSDLMRLGKASPSN